jgi:superfamily I DNA/RNA helicase
VARLAIDKDFLNDYSRLEKSVQASVMAAFEKFAGHTHAGLHLEKLNQSKDNRLRTIRIDQFWRGVVLAPDSGDTYYLLKVLPHDKAIEYAGSHKLSVNQALGVVEVRNEAAIEQLQPTLEQAARTTDDRLFGHVTDKDLERLGVDANVRTIARLLTSENHLDAMQNMMPDIQYTALLGLASGQSPEEVWAEISLYASHEPVDTKNIVKAMERTPSRVVIVGSNRELEGVLEYPFAAWRIFLHPSQEKIAYARRYSGPAQVTGGAGTGKTVTALHRASHLAWRAEQQLMGPEATPSVLLTTFTRNLSDALQVQFEMLEADDDVRAQVEIRNVDSLAYRIVEQARGARPAIVDHRELEALWAAEAHDAAGGYSPSFLNREWEQVILAQGLESEQEYLTASRAGQGTPLGKAQRREVWKLVQRVSAELSGGGLDTHTQLANEAARALRAGSVKVPYRHVIIDEAQDLHPAQWRLLRAAVPAGPDDMFIVGDAHQRIYDNRVSLARMGVNVRGRSKRLTVNYRTTQEILALAVPTLGRASFTGLDDEADTLSGYQSPLHGQRPEVLGSATRESELSALVGRVRAWREAGIELNAIGVAARAGYLVKQATEALTAAGIPSLPLSSKSKKNAVRVGTMHGMKGLEFQAVGVVGVADGVVPLPSAVTPAGADPVAHAQDLQRERCLLFVACTRARDYLYLSYSGSPSPFLPQK